MLVYGDRAREVEPRAQLAQLEGRLTAIWGSPPGLERHGALTALFIDVGALHQGVADGAYQAAGGTDRGSPAAAGLMTLLVSLAEALNRSWRTSFAELGERPQVPVFGEGVLPGRVSARQAEGFAFYALYPEAYLEAGREAGGPETTVVGLRSIGSALAALAAAGAGARHVFTVRPGGPPFERRLSVSDELAQAMLARPEGAFVVADEGPGLSGSSLCGTAEWLMERGVARERIRLLPSHGGEPGREASAEHRRLWRSTARSCRTFEDLFGSGGSAPLAGWFSDLTGKPLAPLKDLSGGAWRGSDLPAFPSQERRKWRLRAKRGEFLLKFTGWDERKLERARRLHAVGFTAEPLALRHGMLLERWIYDEAGGGEPPVEHIDRYLDFRARHLPAERHGASLAELRQMARQNIGEALGDRAAEAILACWPKAALPTLQALVRPIHVDGRLHRWEWLTTPNGWLKTDAIDHSEAHDLVGPQDVAWDVAGAAVEFDLSAEETERLRRMVGADAQLTAFLRPCYLAFQLGLWTFAAAEDACAGRQRDLYADRLRRLV